MPVIEGVLINMDHKTINKVSIKKEEGHKEDFKIIQQLKKISALWSSSDSSINKNGQ